MFLWVFWLFSMEYLKWGGLIMRFLRNGKVFFPPRNWVSSFYLLIRLYLVVVKNNCKILWMGRCISYHVNILQWGCNEEKWAMWEKESACCCLWMLPWILLLETGPEPSLRILFSKQKCQRTAIKLNSASDFLPFLTIRNIA